MTRLKSKTQNRRRVSADLSSRQITDVLAPYQDLLPPGDFSALLETLLQPSPLAIRINPIKVDPGTSISEWATRYHWQFSAISFCPTGFQLSPLSASGSSPSDSASSLRLAKHPARVHPSSFQSPPSRTIEYRLGYFYIQDAASMLPAELFSTDFPTQDSPPLILDMSAAPGGKTTHLVSRWNDRAFILANDLSASRLPALRTTLQDWGAINTAITGFQGELFGAWFPETFDRILLDAPCSMEQLTPGDPHPPRAISPRERHALARRQLNLLSSAFQALKPGAQVVYATCTLAPEEDEAVVDGLLRRYPQQAHLEEVSQKLGKPAPGLVRYQSQVFDESLAKSVRLWPHLLGTSGFFVAVITKTGPVESKKQHPPDRPFNATGLTRLSLQEQAKIDLIFSDQYGYDLETILASEDLGLWRRNQKIFAVPEVLISRFQSLPCLAFGLPLGDENPDGFIPSPAWITRFGQEFTLGRYPLPEELIARWLEGEDLRGIARPKGTPASQVITDSAGRILGYGRFSGDRLRNLLPKR